MQQTNIHNKISVYISAFACIVAGMMSQTKTAYAQIGPTPPTGIDNHLSITTTPATSIATMPESINAAPASAVTLERAAISDKKSVLLSVPTPWAVQKAEKVDKTDKLPASETPVQATVKPASNQDASQSNQAIYALDAIGPQMDFRQRTSQGVRLNADAPALGQSMENFDQEQVSGSTKKISQDDANVDNKNKEGSLVKNSGKIFQQGLASWYGPGFHGRLTANGSIFNMFAMTAAHRTLPLGTYIQVQNPSTGQSVRLLVNDRGPYAGRRILDVSYAAAKKLGILGRGVANIQIIKE